MVILSLLAVGVSSIADMYISSAARGLVTNMPATARLAVLLFVGLVVFANVAAFFLVHITEPSQIKAMAQESARDIIEATTLKEIQKAAPAVAARIAPQLAEGWVQSMFQEYLREGVGTRELSPPDEPPAVSAKKSRCAWPAALS